MNTPWTNTSYIDPNLNFSGWRLGTGSMAKSGVDDSFAFYVGAGETESTLEEAISDNEYISFILEPTSGTLNLNAKKVTFSIRRIDWHAPRQYSLFTGVEGFSQGEELFTTRYLESHESEPVLFEFIMPLSGYDSITGAIEFRIYAYKANYYGHTTSIRAFGITEPNGVYTLDINSTSGGTATSIPEGDILEAGTEIELIASPLSGYRFAGWSGDVVGKGNPRRIIIDDNKIITAHFEPVPTARMAVGTNLGSVSDWGSDWVFVDALKMARTWLTRQVGSHEWESNKQDEIPLDANGWPRFVPFNSPSDGNDHYVHTLLPAFVAGDYTVMLEGEGEIQLSGAASGHFYPDGGENTYLLNVAAGNEGTFLFSIPQSEASDPIHNVRVIIPGFETTYQSQPFHPLYLERLEKFTNLRFMDCGRTNFSPLVNWNERYTPTRYTQTGDMGVALEYMVLISNTLEKDLWICIPHQANDDYVRQAARLLRDSVDPNLKIYVEYSNETWNGIFSQTTYVQDMGEALGLDTDRWRAGQEYCALRSVEIWEIFEDEFVDDTRLVKVMATQSANISITNVRFDALNDPAINPNYTMPDVLAIAPYFGKIYSPSDIPPNVPDYPTVDEILEVSAPAEIASVRNHIQAQKAVADAQGCALVCYEGGQHYVGALGAENDETLTDILISSNRDARMYDRYIEYLNMLDANGVEMFSNFSYVSAPSKWGSWGVLEYMDQPIEQAPKYRALMNWTGAGGRGDFNVDGYVNLYDLDTFCQMWMTNEQQADFDDSNNVDFLDFSVLGQNWNQ